MTQNKEWISWIKLILLAFIVALGVRTFLVTPTVVEGVSMQPTLQDGDRIIINKFSYLISEPKRFDIIVFHANKEQNFIKRIIGLPGEHIHYKDETLYVNGEPINEAFIDDRLDSLQPKSHYTHDFSLEMIPGQNKTIPKGYVLVLGDNRTNSTDSRELGLVSYDQIVGKAIMVYWPFEDLGSIN
ncbi:signal peptidase I [Salirhabdus sp. Marseille-P4669]|uniref:signal peptidase I n=1 Tax=Salirhabdus sp. Marseille-P4669 TaxID=2042310 RepID=UPI000C7D2D94|nr:signal peptidase I [Salirhabdus sp. Marseille-P4669]